MQGVVNYRHTEVQQNCSGRMRPSGVSSCILPCLGREELEQSRLGFLFRIKLGCGLCGVQREMQLVS